MENPNKRLHLSAVLLLVVACVMPLVGTLLISAQSDVYTRQYDVLQFILMGTYNLPFVVASFAALITSNILSTKLKPKPAKIALILSIAISLASCVLILWWSRPQ